MDSYHQFNEILNYVIPVCAHLAAEGQLFAWSPCNPPPLHSLPLPLAASLWVPPPSLWLEIHSWGGDGGAKNCGPHLPAFPRFILAHIIFIVPTA